MDPQTSIGARALSDLAYCPRLFHLEHVDGHWADTEETRLGRHVHAVVDRPDTREKRHTHRIAHADWQVRSLSLHSAELGVTAVCDVVEATADDVRPVEFRRGKPDSAGAAWYSDRVQVLVQIVLLRHNGYSCDRGYLWYDRVRRRVPVVWTSEGEDELRRLLARAHEIADDPKPPPPLVHSARCPPCALLHVCMPDEINELTERDAQRPRRLLASAPDRFPVYITEPGTTVGIRSARLVVRRSGEALQTVGLRDVLHLVIAGPAVQVSTQAIHALSEHGVPIVWTSTGGRLKAVATPSAGKHVELRRRQYTADADQVLEFSRKIVAGKIHNCRTLLRRNLRGRDQHTLHQLQRAVEQAECASSLESLRGIEGAAARNYFSGLAGVIRTDNRLPGPGFDTTGRTRRPPRDAVNCLLSFLYTLLIKDLTTACYALGLDPFFGLYHQPRYGRPAVALDLAEEFRPLIADSAALTLINNHQVDRSAVRVHSTSVTLTSAGRRRVIDAYERRLATEATHPVFEYKLSYRRALELQARIFAAHLLTEIPQYSAFTSR